MLEFATLPPEYLALSQRIRTEAGLDARCLTQAGAAEFVRSQGPEGEGSDAEAPDPSLANSVLFLEAQKAHVWFGHGATANLGGAAIDTIASASSCQEMVEKTAEALDIPGLSSSSASAGGSAGWALVAVLLCAGALVGAIRWQILRKRRADWVEAPSSGSEQVVLTDKETAAEAAQGVVEGGSRAPGRRER